jgi:hypothetical protein
MSNWDDAEKRAKEATAGLYVRLQNDKDKVVLAFVGEPNYRDTFYNPKTNKTETFTEEHKKEGKTPSAKFKLNVWVKEQAKMMIFECNSSTFKEVAACKNKYGLEKHFFEVIRDGKKGDTNTTYKVLPDALITTEELAAIKAAPPHDLTKTSDEEIADGGKSDMGSHDKAKTGTNGTAGTAAPAAPAAAPAETITSEQASKLVARVKVLPKEKIDAFLKRFAVQQVKALKASDYAAAEAFVDELEGKPAVAPAATTEVDPFA